MSILDKIDPRYIVNIDKFSVGLPFPEASETKGKYLIFRSHLTVDEKLYNNVDCCTSVIDDYFLEKMIHVFDDGHLEEQKEHLRYAIQHKLAMNEVDGYKEYQKTGGTMTAEEWRNISYNNLHRTYNVEYVPSPKESYFKRLTDALSFGEYRLGVFIN